MAVWVGIYTTYTPLYRLTNATYHGSLNATYQYQYDAVGNMTFYTETVGTETTHVQRYFNPANQLIDSFDYVAGTTSFYYDGNGNLVEQLPPGAYISHWYTYNQRTLLLDGLGSVRTEMVGDIVVYRGNLTYAYESKTAVDSVRASTVNLSEALKDLELMQTVRGYTPIWFFWDGPPTPSLAETLQEFGIGYVIYNP